MRRPYLLHGLRGFHRHVSSTSEAYLILVFFCCWVVVGWKKHQSFQTKRKWWRSTWFEEKQHIHIVKPIHDYGFFIFLIISDCLNKSWTTSARSWNSDSSPPARIVPSPRKPPLGFDVFFGFWFNSLTVTTEASLTLWVSRWESRFHIKRCQQLWCLAVSQPGGSAYPDRLESDLIWPRDPMWKKWCFNMFQPSQLIIHSMMCAWLVL